MPEVLGHYEDTLGRHVFKFAKLTPSAIAALCIRGTAMRNFLTVQHLADLLTLLCGFDASKQNLLLITEALKEGLASPSLLKAAFVRDLEVYQRTRTVGSLELLAW